jgi:glutathione S-transferase
MLLLNLESHFVSPYGFACYVTLVEKKLAFQTRALESSKDETFEPDYLARTITGRVPSLVDDDFGIAESSAIVEYLEDKHPDPPVLPRGIRERARARQIMSWLRSDDTAAIRSARPAPTMFYASERAKAEPLSSDATKAQKKLFGVVERLLRPGSSTVFDDFTIVDAELAFILHRLILNGDEVPAQVRAFAEQQWKRESVRAYVEHERPSYD